MRRLIVLNGPPAVGKSTLAQMYVDDHPMALRVDIDEVRDALGAWRTDRAVAGRRARALATAMARDHLGAGYDVVVAQAYGQPEHLDELADLADELEASYFEIVLWADEASTTERFVERGGPRLDEAIQGADGLDSILVLRRRIESLARTRSRSRFIDVVTGEVAATYANVLRAITQPGGT